jgi:hypothetical protein
MTWIQIQGQQVAGTAIGLKKTRHNPPLIRAHSLIRETAVKAHLFLINNPAFIRSFFDKSTYQIRCNIISLQPFTMDKDVISRSQDSANFCSDPVNLLAGGFSPFHPLKILNHSAYSCIIISLSRANDEAQLVGGVFHE